MPSSLKRVCPDFLAFEANLSGAHMLMLTEHILVSMGNVDAVIVHLKARYKKHSEAIAYQNLKDIKQSTKSVVDFRS